MAERPNRKDFTALEVEPVVDLSAQEHRRMPLALLRRVTKSPMKPPARSPTKRSTSTPADPSDGWGEYLRKSWKEVFLSTKLNLLLPCILLTFLSSSFGWGDTWTFTFALAGLCPLAERLGFCTEQMAMYTNSTIGGLLNATFGNVTEMIVAIYALKENMLRVVQLSLLGSILSNMLLVLGCAFLFGGMKYKEQNFSRKGVFASCGLLLLGMLALLLPNMLHATHTELHGSMDTVYLSRFISVLMLGNYLAYLAFQLFTHVDLYEEDEDGDEDEEEPVLGFYGSIFWLAVFTVFVSILSDAIVDTIEGATTAWGVPLPFVATIVLPIVGNAAEHAAAVMFALKNKMNISLGVAIGSSAQITIFVIPFTVVLGWAIGVNMDLNMHVFETGSLFASVIIVSILLQDGNSNWLKGLTLVISYMVLGSAFYYHADTSLQGLHSGAAVAPGSQAPPPLAPST